jgi:hypothetical protein
MLTKYCTDYLFISLKKGGISLNTYTVKKGLSYLLAVRKKNIVVENIASFQKYTYNI